MYEEMTYEALLTAMLETAIAKARERGEQLDTREGSMLWYGQAPAAVEGQNLYLQLDTILKETFGDTASRPYLIQRAKERGLAPRAATRAVCRAEVTPEGLQVPAGTRFSLGDLNYAVTGALEDGGFSVQCETPGERGNESQGTLVPVEYVRGLETARLTGLLIPGEEEQGTESFRRDYLESFDTQAYGGNMADYRRKVGALEGVGGVKVRRDWNGNIRPAEFAVPGTLEAWLRGAEAPAEVAAWIQKLVAAISQGLLTVGGAVRLVIIDSAYAPPSQTLIETVQTAVDPEQNHGEGLGLAPIGHYVTVRGVREETLDISVRMAYETGWSWEAVRPYAQEKVDGYLAELTRDWAEQESPLVVRVSGIESRLLTCPGVVDVGDTVINGMAQNYTLDPDGIPVRGVLVGT